MDPVSGVRAEARAPPGTKVRGGWKGLGVSLEGAQAGAGAGQGLGFLWVGKG